MDVELLKNLPVEKFPVNENYQEILDLDRQLTEENIPHELKRLYDGWQILFAPEGEVIGDAIQHCASDGSRHDLIEVSGFGSFVPTGFLSAKKAAKYFRDGWLKVLGEKLKPSGKNWS